MIGDAQTVISILGLTMLGTAGLLALLPVGTCSQCSHCRLEKLSRQREHELNAGRSVSASFCSVCGRHHRADEDHRF
jgi:hypothetical protein